MEQFLVGAFGLVLLFVVPPYFVASAAADFGKNWWRYLFSIGFYPTGLFLLGHFVIGRFPEARDPVSILGSIMLAVYALPASLFWTYCFRNVVRHKKSTSQ